MSRHGSTVRRQGAALLAACSLVCVAPMTGACLSTAAAGTFPGENGTLTFTRSAQDGFDIVEMRPNGGNRHVLVHSPPDTNSYYSDWSPDGRRLVFDSDRTGDPNIFLRRPGGDVVRLTDDPGGDAYPTWTPGGRRIVWQSDRSGSRQIHVMRSDGSHQRQVTDFGPGAEEPSVSPTGRWIAFLSGKVRHTALFVVHPDGTGVHRLTPRRLNAGHPSWSPDGRHIVFNSHIEQPNGRIWVVRVNGLGLRQLTSGPQGVEDYEPTYSPDGRRIAFTSFGRTPTDNADIWIMHSDGTRLHDVTRRSSAYEVGVTWRPRRGAS